MLEQYQQLNSQKVLCEDKAQYAAIVALDKLSKELVLASDIGSRENTSNNLLTSNKILAKLLPNKSKPTVKGLYFYGRVGRGKTMLMDLFYQNIPIKRKKRIHFHRFMESVHQQLNELSLHQLSIGVHTEINPLARIAMKHSANSFFLLTGHFVSKP